MKLKSITAAISLCTLLGACSSTGDLYRSDVYSAHQVNRAQKVEVINIVMISPVRVSVDNRDNQEFAKSGGALLGAIGGALLGHHSTAKLAGGVVGGIAGGLAGSRVGKQNLVDGVSITYHKVGSKQMLNSAQVGQPCEYKEGKAVMLSTGSNETRIQPNNPAGCDKP